jgi:AraC-like DNA-binding protein
MTGVRREGPGYREHPPAADLAPWIECFWTRGAGPAPSGAETYRVLPDGCADVIFAIGRRADGFVVGPMTRAIVVPASGATRMFGVRFHPGAAGAFLPVPLRTLVDQRVALDSIWTGSAATTQRLAEASAAGCALDAFESELRARLQRAAAIPFPRTRALIERLASQPEGASVADMAARAGITRQHLRRVFETHVGYGPKKLARILRLRRALRLLDTRGGATLAAVALDAGYYDQAHMNADFRDLAGRPPLGLREQAAGSISPIRPLAGRGTLPP